MYPLAHPAPLAASSLYRCEVKPLGGDVDALVGFLAQAAKAAIEQIAVAQERAAVWAARPRPLRATAGI